MKILVKAMAFCLVANVSFAEVGQKSPLSTGINSLNYKILNQLQSKEKDKNLFMSSMSIHAALSMAYTGSTGSTKKELATLLGLSAEETLDALGDSWAALRTDLQKADEKVTIEIANSMWGNSDQHVKFTRDFISLNQRAHDAEIRSMDFQDKSFLPTINGWASEKTHGKIKSVLSPPIRKDQLYYLVNAIYFKGAWTTAFDAKKTTDGKFTVGKRQLPVRYMNQGGNYNYFQDEKTGLQAVQIPFGKANRMVMSVFLPKASSDFLNHIDAKNVSNVAWTHKTGTIVIPRFKIEYSNEEMVEVLKSMGVKIAFSDLAEFPNIAEGEQSKINKIIHKAVVEVAEEGAEAAAVTVVGGVRSTSVRVDVPFHFSADHPFYFEINDNESGAVLFSGILKEPTK